MMSGRSKIKIPLILSNAFSNFLYVLFDVYDAIGGMGGLKPWVQFPTTNASVTQVFATFTSELEKPLFPLHRSSEVWHADGCVRTTRCRGY